MTDSTPENARATGRHGRAWRDMEGNEVAPLTSMEWRSIAWIGAVGIVGLALLAFAVVWIR